MNKTVKIIFILIYAFFATIFLVDAYDFLAVKGGNYPQIGYTHTYIGYFLENLFVGIYSIIGMIILWCKRTNKKKIIILYFAIFLIYLIIAICRTHYYWH